MSMERAEELKRQLTDQWVRVTSTTPELKRFANSIGQVRTVNMNCRALVEFFGDKDVSWYDIAPEFLEITDKPDEEQSSPPAGKSRKSGSVKQGEKKATESGRPQQSPLEKIQASSASQAEGEAETGQAGTTSRTVSALDQIRGQAIEDSESESTSQLQNSKHLSPLEQIRSESKKSTD